MKEQLNVKGEGFVDGFRVLMDENFWESIVKKNWMNCLWFVERMRNL